MRKGVPLTNRGKCCRNQCKNNVFGRHTLQEKRFCKKTDTLRKKGCFVGQEITARMKYRALLKKQLYALEIISGKINIGDNIIEKEVNLGEVISKANQYIFCMLKIQLVNEKSKNKSLLKINSFVTLKFL